MDSVFPDSTVLVQSPEGQERVREIHARCMKALDAYPTIRKHVHHDKWGKEFLKKQLASTCTIGSLGYPELFWASEVMATGVWPSDYLERAEKGLEFIVQKARKLNRTDLLGNLQKCPQSSSEVFEIMLAWSLVQQFGEDDVEPYPYIAPGSKQTVDFAVKKNGATILIEAVILLEPRNGVGIKSCGQPVDTFAVSPLAGKYRLLETCSEKAMQRRVSHPLILAVNQIALQPWPDIGIEAIGELVGWSVRTDESMLVAAAYFTQGHCQSYQVAESRAAKLGTNRDLIAEVYLAASRLAVRVRR